MDRLFRLRRDKLRYNAIVNIEKRAGIAVKCALLLVALLAAWFTRLDGLRQPLLYVYFGILISGTLTYTHLYRRFSPNHRVAFMTLSSCLEVFYISFIYCIFARENLVPIVFLLFPLPILRLTLFYPSVLEFLLTAGSSSAVFLLAVATLGLQQLTLLSFWAYFAATCLVFGLATAIVDRLFTQLNQSVKNRHLILQALQMVSSLVEMAESTAHLHERNKIFQRSVEIVSRVMAVNSCVAWVYEDGKLCPAASEGLDEEQAARFQEMELSMRDIPVFDRSLAQKVPIVVTGSNGDLKEVPLSYRQWFRAGAMLVIPLTDSERILGCVALHWLTAPEKITSQELAILSGIATQVGITLENVYLLEELREKEEVRGRLLERVISIQEEERERIARELHDETGQILTALMVDVELLKTESELQSARSQERFDEISSLLSKTMEDIHNLSLDLHPKILNELGLVPAIRWYAKNHLGRWAIDFSVSADNLNHSLSAKEEMCLFRVTQEAITNVIRHAQARRVDIEIGVDAESVFLSVRDDGKGFGLDPHRDEACLGLRSMEERVSFLDGQIDIRSEVGKGTEISVNIPLQKGCVG